MGKKAIISVLVVAMVLAFCGIFLTNFKKNNEVPVTDNIATYGSNETQEANYKRVIMIDDEIYSEVGEVNIKRCGVCDGEINSCVNNNEKPCKNNQSNFGKGYRYQKVDKNIDVCIGDKWIRFSKEN